MQWFRLAKSMTCRTHPSRWSRWSIAAAMLAAGCLNVDSVPSQDPDACAERTDPDPLVGVWASEAGTCEFFSNARYTADCGIDLSGFPSEWMLLEDGRYYFGASSLGSPSGECLGVATFADGCQSLTLKLDCSRGKRLTVELTRRQ